MSGMLNFLDEAMTNGFFLHKVEFCSVLSCLYCIFLSREKMAALKVELEAFVTEGEAKMAEAAAAAAGEDEGSHLNDEDLLGVGGEWVKGEGGEGQKRGGGRRWSEDERKVRKEMKAVRHP